MPQAEKSAEMPEIPDVAMTVFQSLLSQPLRDVPTLRDAVDDYVVSCVRATHDYPTVDAEQAGEIGAACQKLLDAVTPETKEQTRRLIQAAVMYFVADDDAQDDLTLGGLDDDAAVVNAVLRHIGQGEAAVEID